jgi:hypothetical protein
MSNLSKKWVVLAAAMGGLMFQFSGCWSGQWRWIWAILEEDIFS